MRIKGKITHQGWLDRYGPWAVVAGASTGIGAGFSEQLAAKGLNLIMIALTGTRLAQQAAALEQRFGIETLCLEMDLADPESIARLREHLPQREVGLLVYVACHSVIGEFLQVSLADKLKMVDVNVRAPLLFIDELAPAMQRRGRGGILLMSSLSGFQGSAMVATYAATKAFNTVLAEGLWSELQEDGVDVLALVAGATHTPTFDALTPEHRQKSVYPMQPDAVVGEALQQLGHRPTHIAGGLNRVVNWVLRRILSRRNAIRFISHNTKRVYRN